MKFWDTSALFALLVDHQGSDRAKAALAGDPDASIWWGTAVELASGAARLLRMKEIDEAHCTRILASIGPIVRTAEEIQPNEEVRQIALRLIRVHDLTAADSLQLAAALVWARHVPAGLEFVCLDTKLRSAAEKEGFTVLG